jgi:PAS domain-containing protein
LIAVSGRKYPPAQQSLQLILARSLISTLSTPAFLVDTHGTVVFYNEAAGDFLGMHYEETGKMSLSEWRAKLAPLDEGGRPFADDHMPITVALRENRPVHVTSSIHAAERTEAAVDLLALPLIGTEDQHEGAVGVFWPHEDPSE